jgi:hypothetical protein
MVEIVQQKANAKAEEGKKIRTKKKQDETRIEREDPYPIYGSTF